MNLARSLFLKSLAALVYLTVNDYHQSYTCRICLSTPVAQSDVERACKAMDECVAALCETTGLIAWPRALVFSW